MKMVKQAYYLFALLMMAVMVSCTTVPKPEGLDQQIAYGYASVAAVRNTAAELLTRRQITVGDAEVVQKQADTARLGLDQARTLLGQGLPNDARGQLLLATQVLTALETYLQSKQGAR